MRVLIFGTFDGLHPGHQFVVASALARGDVTIVVARDATVRRIKARQPRWNEGRRVAELQAKYPSAQVVLGHPDDFREPLRLYRPDVILLGYDQRLPPGVSEADLPAPVERLPAHHPDKYKSSLLGQS